MKAKRSVHVERIGVLDVGKVVHRDLEWLYREQPVVDYGIDAHIEVVEDDDEVTGQLIAVQVRSRERPFDRISGGWAMRDDLDHLDYWLGHVLPVIVVIYDVPTERAYWQRVSPHTVVRTESGFKIEVPESQPLDASSRDALGEIAARDDDRALDRFDAMCGFLPPPSVDGLKKAHAEVPLVAARLAALLAEGRAQPSMTAQSVLAAPPRGMTDRSWLLWQAVGSYAAEHGVRLPAAEAFERASAHAENGTEARLLGLAACLRAEEAIANTNHDTIKSAQRAIDATRYKDGSSLLADLAEAVVRGAEHDGRASWVPRKWRLPPSIKTLGENDLRQDAMLSIAVGDELLIHGDVEGAILRFQSATDALPTSSGPKLKLAHALVRRAIGRSALPAADYEDAERLARAALADRRRWAGPSEEALELLLHILLARSAFTEAVRQSLLDPAGSALRREAGHDGVRILGARAAIAIGRLDVADDLAAGIDDPLRLAQFTAWRNEIEDDAPAKREAWEQVAKLACDSCDLSALLLAAHNLAACGVWPVCGLDDAATAGVLPQHLMAILAAKADAANGNLDRAVAALRPIEAENLLAVELHAQILGVDAVDEAVDVCLRGADRFQAPHLRFMAAELLARSGDDGRAESMLLQLLASGAGSDDARRAIRLRLIEHAYSRSDWSAAEGYALAELRHARRPAKPPVGRPVDETDQFAWAVIGARFNRRELDAAQAAWERYKPAIASVRQAGAWLQLQRAGAWTIDGIDQALSIAERWPYEEQLVSHVIATILLQSAQAEGELGLRLSRELGARLANVQARYHAQYPDGRLQMVEFQLDQFVQDMTVRLESISRVSADLEPMVRDHRLPVGTLASAFGRPYALAVLTRPAGVTPAGTPFESDYDTEIEAAARALDRGVAVCDASALYVTVLLDQHWPTIRGQFHRLLLPHAAYDDLVRAMDELVVPTSATMQFDRYTGRLVLHTPEPEVTSLVRERATAMEARARTLERLTARGLTVLPDQDLARDGAWLAPIQLAFDTGSALYADDVALRQLARGVGVEAFGTLALLHTMMDRGDLADVTDEVLRVLVAEYVVDLPMPLDLLIDIAEGNDWLSGPATTVVTRPRWWADVHDAAHDFLEIVRRVASARPDALRQWVFAAAHGVAGSTTDTKADAIAMIASLVVARVTGLAGSPFNAVVTGAREAAAFLGIEDPTQRMIAAICAVAAELSGLDPDDLSVCTEVEAAFSAVDR